MSGTRVLMVARRYWPHCDDSVQRFMGLVDGLRRAGFVPTVLTPRHAPHWPDRLYHRETQVIRPLDLPRSAWGLSRYVKLLSKWIAQRSGDFDLIYVDGMREEASAAVQAGNAKLPTIVRLNGYGTSSDAVWWREGRGGASTLRNIVNIFGRTTYLAPRAGAVQQLLSAGISAEQVVRIEDGVPASPRTAVRERTAARRALASICRELRLQSDSRLIVAQGRMTRHSGMWDLLSAAGSLVNRWPNDRVWLVGEGPDRDRIAAEIHLGGLVGDVLMPGSFDHLDELLDAADVAIVSADAECMEHFLPAAIARGVPILAAANQELRGWFGADAELITWYPSGQTTELSTQLMRLLAGLEDAGRRADLLRTRMLARRSQQACLDAHQRLFERLVRSRAIEPSLAQGFA